MSEHYFSPAPEGPARERTHRLVIRGNEYTVTTASGTFSAGRLDKGTQVLLSHVADPPSQGTFLDLGCGWGPVALAMAQASPGATVLAVDVNERAVELTSRNAAASGLANIHAYLPDDLEQQLHSRDQRLDLIWSNPPVRVGKKALHNLLSRWLPLLSAEGQAWLVVSKNLGADSLARWLAEEGWQVSRVASSKGFRVLVVSRV